MEKKKKRPETGKALMRRFTALVMGAWLLIMWLLTYATAKDFLFQIYHQAETYARTGYGISSSEYDPELSGMAETGMIRTTGFHHMHLHASRLFPFAKPQRPSTINGDDWIFGKWDLMYGYEAAVAYYDKEEDFYLGSGNYITFTYTDEEKWKAKKPEAQGFAYIDLDATEGLLKSLERVIRGWPDGDPHVDFFTPLLRLRGYFEGNRFIPASVDTGRYFPIYPETEIDRTPESYSNVDARGKVDWETVFITESMPEHELVTVYGWDSFGILADYEPVTVNGVSFDGLPELLKAKIYGEISFTRENIWDAVFVHYGHCDFYVNDKEMGDYGFAIAVRCWPMGYAAWRLLPTYLVTLAVAILIFFRLRRRIRRSIVTPLENAIIGFDQGLPSRPWHEPQALLDKTKAQKEALHEAETQIQQLHTALDYAHDAEEKRRRLVSDLTHELKTPLAIIHGYAEGLKSGIAEEKKERYLDIILEESERMDAMVLQMLDLSRLEAGKVRLSTDTFSLLGLVKTVAEKFSLAMEEKRLQLHFVMENDFPVTADEARIRQVVTNLMSNAVKYATEGGNIRIWVYKSSEGAKFEIENTSLPLPTDAMEKIFDSFYRVDASRTEPGTGLGLAIVKTIAELHRGKCTVRNKRYKDETCVEFSVTLPLN